MTPTSPRRRWYQFGLRTMFMVVTLVAIFVAWITKERRQSAYELQLAEQFQLKGFQTIILGPYDSLQLQNHKQPQGWWRDAARSVLGGRICSVGNTGVVHHGESDIPALLPLTNLQQLYLGRQECDLTNLGDVKNLVFLHIVANHANDLTEVPRLKKLKHLNVFRADETDLSPIAELANLEELQIHSRQGCDLMSVVGLKNLKRLYLVGTPVTKEQIETLQKALPNCQIVYDSFP